MSTPPPIIARLESVTFPAAHASLRAFHAAGPAAFKVYLDDACALPGPSWRDTWSSPQQWGKTGDRNWATKAGAAGFIPWMIASSPFATDDWRQASASVVVLFARHYAGGPTIAQQQCLQRLRTRSAAWRATNGSKHFFVLTDSRGPCSIDGKYKDVDFLSHHVIGPHAEPPPDRTGAWFFRSGEGPRIPCYDARKDIGIPTPNIHFPRTPFAPALPDVHNHSAARPLLLFYAGWSYGCRMAMVRQWRNDEEMLVRRSVKQPEYKRNMLRARFCPICGGYSQWTPRLAEALYYECVPIILSEHMEPPFASLLDWSTFSARLTEAELPSLKSFVKALDYDKLVRGVRLAKRALEYHLGTYDGDDMLPLLLHQMSERLRAGPIVRPPNVLALSNDVETDRDYDANLRNDKSQCAHAVAAHAAVKVDGVRWDCVTTDGYQAGCSTKGAADAAGHTTSRPRRCRQELVDRGWVRALPGKG